MKQENKNELTDLSDKEKESAAVILGAGCLGFIIAGIIIIYLLW